ncbi:MAG TPA: YigZ family protein [Clostridia bacterium]|nr:YigZ family protein [Clostridia bacterium]
MRKEYLTVSREASAEFEEKKSRFIATVRPVACEEEAHGFVEALRSKYWNATHNVYAYYICGENTQQKFSDDGEPSGTAGLPVLEAIRKLDAEDVAVVVTRYFGGTLLGASGLVRAYGKSATLGLEAAGIVKRQLCIEAGIAMDYSLLGKLQALAASKGYRVKDTIYAQDVDMYLYIPVDEFEAFSALVTETTNAKAIVYAGDKSYITIGV